MPKAIKIDVCGVVSEVDDMHEDPDYKEMESHDPWALHVPMSWKYKKYCLTMVCKGIFEESDTINLTASYLYHHLYSKNGHPPGPVVETVWFLNEDQDKCLDMTKEDIEYILKHTRLHIEERERLKK